MAKKGCVCVVITGVVGAIFVVAGISLIYVFRDMIQKQVKEQVRLLDKGDTFDAWKKPPVPIYFQVWVWDIRNHDEVVQSGATPTLVQRGPYTYREYREKVNITFNDNSTVTYREDRSFVFDREKSIGNETDKFTTVNLPFLTVVNLVRFEYNFIKELVDLVLEFAQENVFIELSVADLLWGYEDNLLKDVDKILERFNKSIDDHFGLFYNQNGSDDGVYNVYTGVKDSSRFAVIGNWNYASKLSFWESDNTNMLNGTDGTMYPPYSDINEPVYIFSSDICRSLYATYNYSYNLKGIPVNRFIIPKETFMMGPDYPYNYGFCTPNKQSCLPSGLLNVSNCRQGAPIIMSQPHFLSADQKVIDGVDGVHPDPKQHSTVLDIEPMTGVVMNAAKKLQINVPIGPIKDITALENLHHVFMPIMWLNESAMIDDKSAQEFKDKVQEPIKITEAVQYGLITLGAFILVCVIAIGIKRSMCKQMDIPLKDMGTERETLLPSE